MSAGRVRLADFATWRFVVASESTPDAAQLDAALVARMARGDRAALGQLFLRYAPRLLSIGAGVLGDPSEAEDVLQEVFLEAFRRSRSFDPNRGSVASWLFVRMRSRCLDRKKSASHRRLVLDGSMPAPARHSTRSDAELDLGVRALDHRHLAMALSDLGAHHSEVLLLGYFDDLSCSEIGARLGVPVGTVKSRVRRALELLRERLVASQGAS